MNKNILKTTIIVIVCFVSCFITGCQKEENFYDQQQYLLENSLELEEYIIAGVDFQHALNTFNTEIKNINFSQLNTSKDTKGNLIVYIPTSVSIEEKSNILNEKKKSFA
jgi:hypothetical protein